MVVGGNKKSEGARWIIKKQEEEKRDIFVSWWEHGLPTPTPQYNRKEGK